MATLSPICVCVPDAVLQQGLGIESVVYEANTSPGPRCRVGLQAVAAIPSGWICR